MKKSDVKRFYNQLVDERNVQASTVDTVHTVLHQVLQMAVDDRYISNNPSDGVLKELKKSLVFKTEKRRGLTKPEQELLLSYLKSHHVYRHWYPIFAVMIGTGLRIGEVAGLRWCDIDLDEGIIDINHQGTMNKTIRKITRDCNDEVLMKGEDDPVLLPHFSCHSLRHTFTTRMCEAGVNVKVIQDTLGHADISTTLGIYADVTREFKKQEFAGLDEFFKGQKSQVVL